MLPVIVLILFFNGAVNAANMVLSQVDDKKQAIAVLFAIGLGILPAWQTAEVWNQSLSDSFRSSSYSVPYKSNSSGLSEAGKANSKLP